MDLLEALGHVGLFARLSLILGVAPLAVAVAYVIRPTAERLAILRPLSLASIFGALAALTAGVLAILMRLQ